MAQAFADFEHVYTDISRAATLQAAYAKHKDQINQLKHGLETFARPSPDVAAKLKRGEAVPLANTSAGDSGGPGTAAATWERISKLLRLHEGQSVLLVKRWVEQHVPEAKSDWAPDPDQLRSICQFYFTQRWHLLLTLRYVIDVSVFDGHPDKSVAVSILRELGPAAVLKSLLTTVTGTLSATGSAVASTSGAHLRSGNSDGALALGDDASTASWQQQAECELCCMQLCILPLLRSADADAESAIAFTHALIDHMLRPHGHEIDDAQSMRALAARLGTAIALTFLGCECAPFDSLRVWRAIVSIGNLSACILPDCMVQVGATRALLHLLRAARREHLSASLNVQTAAGTSAAEWCGRLQDSDAPSGGRRVRCTQHLAPGRCAHASAGPVVPSYCRRRGSFAAAAQLVSGACKPWSCWWRLPIP